MSATNGIKAYAKSLGYGDLLFLSTNAFFSNDFKVPTQFPKQLIQLLDGHHAKPYANQLKQFVLSVGRRDKILQMHMSCSTGWYILTNKENQIVAVAQLRDAGNISTITVPEQFRKQGHAKAMFRILGHLCEKYRFQLVCPTNLTHEQLLNYAGWSRSSDKIGKGNTIDLMPECVKVRYRQRMRDNNKRFFDPNDANDIAYIKRFICFNTLLLTASRFGDLTVPKR